MPVKKPAPKKRAAPKKLSPQDRLDKIDAQEAALKEKSEKLHASVEDKRDRKDDAKNDQRKEDLADAIDALRSERRRIQDRLRVLAAKEQGIEDRVAERRNRRDDYASKHFRWDEFNCKDGTPIPEQSKPALREWCQKIGEPARLKFGVIYITSGFRPQAYNASIGGASNSVHIWDWPGRDYKAVAVDWHAENGSVKDWFEFAKQAGADGNGYYPSSGFVHSDTRGNLGWPDAEWSG